MAPKPDATLLKITLNLYEEDVAALKAYYGHGWSEQVRQVVHQHVASTSSWHRVRKTLGDLE